MKVLLATGGSGGHIFPAVQTAQELKKRGHDIVFAGALAEANARITAMGFKCVPIRTQGLTDKSWRGVARFARAMLGAYKDAARVVRIEAPDKIIGFGGYGSFALVVAGRMRHIPTMIHEQNVMPGKANRVLARFTDRVAISFEDSRKYFNPTKVIKTGCPCNMRPSERPRAEICRTFGLSIDLPIIALLGGSQGSKRLNEVFYEAILVLARDRNMQGVHMTGKNEYPHYADKYTAAGVPVHVSAFISPVEELYAIADVIISRAGAATVSELGAHGIPSVLVPYPFAGNHQKYNAQVLSKAGAAILIEQNALTASKLLDAVTACRREGSSRDATRNKTREIFHADAAQRLADAVEGL